MRGVAECWINVYAEIGDRPWLGTVLHPSRAHAEVFAHVNADRSFPCVYRLHVRTKPSPATTTTGD